MQQTLIDRLQPDGGDQERVGFLEWVRVTVVGLKHDVWRRTQREMVDVLSRALKENDASLSTRAESSSCISPSTPTGSAEYLPADKGAHYVQLPQSQQMWQPLPHMWPPQVQNPTSVWGSSNPEWVQQQFPNMGFQCGASPAQPQPFSAPPFSCSPDPSGFGVSFRNLDTNEVKVSPVVSRPNTDQTLNTPELPI
ncbi:Hypp5409 [Branchiostoma lanceolatum]|uniref:Hypp5409 protein n=1 Tax=Branchiostoma lanceolatum TaxID=7740 RepID=A0A8K0AGN4_BRALA|nr:Hypp5409 [Branchiostoma lanceolatum]